jgi:hypothetical protein
MSKPDPTCPSTCTLNLIPEVPLQLLHKYKFSSRGLIVSGSVVIGEVLVKALAGFGRGLVGTFRRSCVRSLHTIHVTQNTQERESESESESEREVEKHKHAHAHAPARLQTRTKACRQVTKVTSVLALALKTQTYHSHTHTHTCMAER